MPININDSMISLDKALDAVLRASGDIMAWSEGKIHEKQADSGDIDNYILWQCMAGGDENTSPVDSAKVLYLIVCVSTSKLLAEQGSSLVETCLCTSTPTGEYWAIPGWHVYWCNPGRWHKEIMTVQKINYWAVGKFYEIRFDRLQPG